MAKRFELEWVFDDLAGEPGFTSRYMFGGKAAYLDGKIVLCIMEDDDSRWQGVLLPTEKVFHTSLMAEFPSLEIHPILPKWLYLPIAKDDFEETALKISKFIMQRDERFGAFPKPKVRRRKS